MSPCISVSHPRLYSQISFFPLHFNLNRISLFTRAGWVLFLPADFHALQDEMLLCLGKKVPEDQLVSWTHFSNRAATHGMKQV